MILSGRFNLIKKQSEYFRLKTGFTNYAVSAIQLYYLLVFQFKKDLPRLQVSFGGFADVFISFLSINILVYLVSAVFGKRPVIKAVIDVVIIFFYHQLFAYQVESSNTLDFSVMIANIDLAFTPEAVYVIFAATGIAANITVSVILAALIYGEFRYRILGKSVQQNHLVFKSSFLAVIYIAIIYFNIPTRDNVTYFFQTLAHSKSSGEYAELLKGLPEYPNVRQGIEFDKKINYLRPGERKPNVIIIMVESFNSSFINRYSRDNIEITPFFNSMIKKGLYIDKFYGNTIQTAKGQFSLLFSTIPSIKGKVFKHYQHNRFRSLAEILRDNGYNTLFYQAYQRVDSDNTKIFLKRNGFDSVLTADPADSAGNPVYPSKKRQLWGIEDSEFYDRFFAYSDSSIKKEDSPSFIVLSTIINHRNFNRYSDDRKLIYKKPSGIADDFSNSIHITDRDLKHFFSELGKRDYLKNTIVIVTGDHGYPLGGHGLSSNETGFYDESFRIPLLMIWPGRIKPSVISSTAFSQHDIAPSILDMLGIRNEKNHFDKGISFISFPERNHYIYLVQPYSGQYLEVVYYPFKYIVHNRTKKEYLFNLADDPTESRNLIKKEEYRVKAEELRGKVKDIYINQLLIEKNRIFDK